MRREYVKCSLPSCYEKVSYRQLKNDRFEWRTFCDKHRNAKRLKVVADGWKLQQGCINRDGRYGGIPCSSTLLNPGQLQVNHIDGNNLNRDSSNIEVICGNCHHIATVQQGHHLNQKYKRMLDFAETGLFVGLFDET